MTYYAGIDLHSNNHVLVLIDENDKRVYEKRLPNSLNATLSILAPFREDITDIAIESTFNWYWLVDGLEENDYPVSLVNTAAVKQYDGLKYSGDHHDAFHLAHLSRLGILPTGYIYPKAQRAVRDLLRRRMQLVQLATKQILSIQNQVWRSTGNRLSSNEIKKKDFTLNMLTGHLYEAAQCNLIIYRELQKQIERLEASALKELEESNDYRLLRSMKGIGPILAMTLLLETGDIRRFEQVGHYASYCRCVQSLRESNGKKKGEGNAKSGNKYLSWAFSQVAHYAIRFEPKAKAFYERKRQKRNGVVATRAVAHKMARAVWHMLTKQQEYDVNKVFG
jgi:transposase